MQNIDFFDPALLGKYNSNGPRYTSYPTALEFDASVSEKTLVNAGQTSPSSALSLYVHIPFCHTLCYYCGCNKIVTRHSEKADRYLDFLAKEIQQRSYAFAHYKVRQLHLGGGSPSFLNAKQHQRLMTLLRTYFNFADEAECSIELDPRRADTDYISALADVGYRRLSLGVQDVNEQVQVAINRVQSTQHIAQVVQHAKNVGFESVNIDLIYGLPHQNTTTFAETIAAVKGMNPERISLFSYAHLPERFAAQRKIKDAWLPSADTKLALMKMATHQLTDFGYELIGMDHFAKPNDELAIAQTAGELHRNFQGYTTRGDLDLLGLGVSSISAVHNMYGQNPKTLNDYYAAVESAQISLTCKGALLNRDDMIRRDVIMQLMCNLSLDIAEVETQWHIDFNDYFAESIANLAPFIEDHLITMTSSSIVVSQKARLLIRVISMCFDAYLGKQVHQQRYSRVI